MKSQMKTYRSTSKQILLVRWEAVQKRKIKLTWRKKIQPTRPKCMYCGECESCWKLKIWLKFSIYNRMFLRKPIIWFSCYFQQFASPNRQIFIAKLCIEPLGNWNGTILCLGLSLVYIFYSLPSAHPAVILTCSGACVSTLITKSFYTNNRTSDYAVFKRKWHTS